MTKRALITGISGQLGSYLAELLISKGYNVHGILRRSSSFNTSRINHIFDRLTLHYGDLSDATGLRRILEVSSPDECYHLAAMSHVRVSFDQPEYTSDVIATGTLRLLETIRDYNPAVRIFHASSSEMFGSTMPPQNEYSAFHPRSPYACSKAAAHYHCMNYREAYNMHVSSGIMFNSESPRRGETFVTRKITRAAARIKLGLQDNLTLGNMDARRDWTFAGDTVVAMHAMLQQDSPSDYVVCSGQSHSVEEFAAKAFDRLGLDWKLYIDFDPRYLRPAEVNHLCGNSYKARSILDWKTTVSFEQLVAMMVDSDLKLAEQEKILAPR